MRKHPGEVKGGYNTSFPRKQESRLLNGPPLIKGVTITE